MNPDRHRAHIAKNRWPRRAVARWAMLWKLIFRPV